MHPAVEAAMPQVVDLIVAAAASPDPLAALAAAALPLRGE